MYCSISKKNSVRLNILLKKVRSNYCFMVRINRDKLDFNNSFSKK